MSKPQQKTISFAALAFDIGADGVSNEAHLLPAGSFRAEDGRPDDCEAWQLTPEIAAGVIARMAAKTNDTLIDYEHQSLHKEKNGKPAPAAGWFHQLEFRDDGLWAVNIGWTESAKRHIKAKEYRYISAVFLYYKGTGEVLEIVSVALTNTPALDGLNSLAALSKYYSTDLPNTPSGDEAMDKTQELAVLTVERDTLKTNIASLTAERDALKTDVVALSLERDTLKAKVETIEKAQAQAALAAEKKAHSDLLATALSDGRLAPAQKAWAEKQSLAVLTEYLEATKPLVADGRQADNAGAADANNGLNETELAMCSSMGVDPKVFAATKQAEAERKAKAKA